MKRLFLITMITLSACSTSRLNLYSPTLGAYDFNYSVEAPSKTGVIQAFDDGKDTYLKIYRPNRGLQGLTFVETGANKPLKVSPVKRNLLCVSGLHDAITVESGGMKSYITRLEAEIKEGSRCKSSQDCRS